MKINYIAKEQDKDKKLKDILKRRLYISSELLKKIKYADTIYVNGKLTYTNYLVQENDNIEVDLEKYITNKKDQKFEDKFELVDKTIDSDKKEFYLVEKKNVTKFEIIQ